MQTPTQEIVSGSGYGMGWRITEDDFGIKTDEAAIADVFKKSLFFMVRVFKAF